ncbi:MAG: PTS IIA-like nitrogen-regulatory protein PtsN [marine bacterium B5-7]|nr:MAG: PTS IIA-like nitrogen-regulatory protein PtsN [marine bacterium B5-7]
MNCPTTANQSSAPEGDSLLSRFVAPERVAVNVQVSSKKRLLEEVADLLSSYSPDLDRDTVFQILNERERLGSTGIGEGFAIPHGRINGIEEPIICAILLNHSLDFDSIDNQPVRCVVGLLVPADANQTHLQILARLAGAFSKPEVRKKIMECQSKDDYFDLINQLD